MLHGRNLLQPYYQEGAGNDGDAAGMRRELWVSLAWSH